jgi:hypothetical protein
MPVIPRVAASGIDPGTWENDGPTPRRPAFGKLDSPAKEPIVNDVPRAFDESDTSRLAPALEQLTHIVSTRTARERWRLAWQSTAANDRAVTAATLRIDGTAWGNLPVDDVLLAIRLLLEAVVEHVKAVHLMLDRGGELPLAIDSETRAALEAAALIWWLLDSRLTACNRVARFYAYRRATTAELERVHERLGLRPDGDESLVSELDHFYQGELGLNAERRRDEDSGRFIWYYGGQRTVGYTERVRAFLAGIGRERASGPYAYYCGASHSEGWRVQFAYAEVIATDGSTTMRRHTAAATINMAVVVCIDALWYAAKCVYEYIGDGAGLAQLHELVPALKSSARMQP